MKLDPLNTKVLLIGTSEFPEDASITSIPNVVINLETLKETLSNPEIIGIPESNIKISLNQSKVEIERHLLDIVNGAYNKKYSIIIYYTGHGILSSVDFKLYLTTVQTSIKYLESDGVNIDIFKQHIKRSIAGRKIMILDCCHSGAILGSMTNFASTLANNELIGFEGTYVMTSASENNPSLFPHDKPEIPTYFTSKLIDVLRYGLNNGSEFCSLREIFNEIKYLCRLDNLPIPQQSINNNIDELLFSKNLYEIKRRLKDTQAWKNLEANAPKDKWRYFDFLEKYPKSQHVKEAKQKINALEAEEMWNNIKEKNQISLFLQYLDQFPDSEFSAHSKLRLQNLRKQTINSTSTYQIEDAEIETPKEERTENSVESSALVKTETQLLPATEKIEPLDYVFGFLFIVFYIVKFALFSGLFTFSLCVVIAILDELFDFGILNSLSPIIGWIVFGLGFVGFLVKEFDKENSEA